MDKLRKNQNQEENRGEVSEVEGKTTPRPRPKQDLATDLDKLDLVIVGLTKLITKHGNTKKEIKDGIEEVASLCSLLARLKHQEEAFIRKKRPRQETLSPKDNASRSKEIKRAKRLLKVKTTEQSPEKSGSPAKADQRSAQETAEEDATGEADKEGWTNPSKKKAEKKARRKKAKNAQKADGKKRKKTITKVKPDAVLVMPA